MRIAELEVRAERVPLTRPYAIAFAATETADLVLARVVLEIAGARAHGFGCAAPVPEITGETFERAHGALTSAARAVPLETADVDTALAELAPALDGAPAARAALDMALHDARARAAGRPLVAWFGRVHDAFPTSITIGIRSLDETLAEAAEYRARGFDVLKVKVGTDLDLDVERLARLREELGARVVLRADANMGYDVAGLERFAARTRTLDLECLEQPCPPALDDELRRLPAELRARLVADESLHVEADAERLARAPQPFGAWNVKLAKCGGLGPARRLARAAEVAGVGLMWGCMDESVVSIAAALHVALASRATRYLDLDGSFDLSRDPARGGFALDRGWMRTLDVPGLGVEVDAWV